MQVLGPGERCVPLAKQGTVHRVDAAAPGRQHGELEQSMDLFGQVGPWLDGHVCVLRYQTAQLHSVLGQRTRLVDAQDGRRAQRLDDGRAPRQHLDHARQIGGA